jgi:hypothetical protein
MGDVFVKQGGEHSKKIKVIYQTRLNLYSIDYQHDLFMPIKEPLDANSRKTMGETNI